MRVFSTQADVTEWLKDHDLIIVRSVGRKHGWGLRIRDSHGNDYIGHGKDFLEAFADAVGKYEARMSSTNPPPGLTQKGRRMYEHVKRGYKLVGDARAEEIAARTVQASAKRGVRGLVKNPADRAEFDRLFRNSAKWARDELWTLMQQARRGTDLPDAALEMANGMLGWHGVEALRGESYQVDKYYSDIIALYVNNGDTYRETLLYDTEFGQWYVTSWGDWYEAWERAQEAAKGLFLIGRSVGGGTSDTYATEAKDIPAGDLIAELQDIALWDPGTDVEFWYVYADDAGAARLMKIDDAVGEVYRGRIDRSGEFKSKTRNPDGPSRDARKQTFLEPVARTLWVVAWADWAEEHKKLPRGPVELFDEAPDTPDDAYACAHRFMDRVAELNGKDMYGLYLQAATVPGKHTRKPTEEDFAYTLTMQALGHGVSWFDDHPHFPIVLPDLEAISPDGETFDCSMGGARKR